MMALSLAFFALQNHGDAHRFARCSPTLLCVSARVPYEVVAVRDPFSLLAAARFLADEMGDELPLKTGAAQTALFLASLSSPGSLPNPFADTRWEPRVYAAKDGQGRVCGLVQTALANIAPTEPGGARGALRTVRFFQNVVVANGMRRQGVASSLLDVALAADDRYNAALAVDPQNEAAVRLYERNGFRLVESEPEREGVRLMLVSAAPRDDAPSTTRSGAGSMRMMAPPESTSDLEWRKQRSGDPSAKGGGAAAQARVNELATARRRAEVERAMGVRDEYIERLQGGASSASDASRNLRVALQRADAQQPDAAAGALLNAMGEAHMAGLPPDNPLMRAAAARVAEIEAR
jgi:GNAT superfamily N-acetyltransferase